MISLAFTWLLGAGHVIYRWSMLCLGISLHEMDQLSTAPTVAAMPLWAASDARHSIPEQVLTMGTAYHLAHMTQDLLQKVLLHALTCYSGQSRVHGCIVGLTVHVGLDVAQDLPGALDDAAVAEGLNLHAIKNRDWAIFKTSAIKGEGLFEGLDWLSNQLKTRKR